MGQSFDQALQKELNYQPTRQDYINASNSNRDSRYYEEAAKKFEQLALVGLCTGNPALMTVGIAGSIDNTKRSQTLKQVNK